MVTTTLRPGATGTSVVQLQNELRKLGYLKISKATGFYGPKTKAAVDAFEKKKFGRHDGVADARTRNAIHAASATRTSSTTQSKTWKTVAKPPDNYRRVSSHGATINVRTREMLKRAETYLRAMGVRSPIRLSQGSYSHSVSASAGTHDGGGAMDIRISGMTRSNADKVVKALRMAGFAAWRRGQNDGFAPHIHAIAIGDRQMSSSARSQVREYFRGGDGLRGNRPDLHRNTIGRPIPNWARKYA